MTEATAHNEMTTLISMPEAARRLGYHPKSVRRALARQGIPLVRQGGAWYVRDDDLARAAHRPAHRPPAGTVEDASMQAHRLVNLIQQHGVTAVARAVADQAVATVRGLRDGWDVGSWRVTQASGAALFVRYAQDGTPAEGVLWLNAEPGTAEANELEQVAREAGFPVTVIYRQPCDVPF